MNASRSFLKVVRKIALARLKASPKQWQIYRRQRMPIWQKVAIAFFAPVALFGIAILLIALPLMGGRESLAPDGTPNALGCLIVGVVAAITIGHAAWIVQELLSSRSLAVASQLPLSDTQFLHSRLKRALQMTIAAAIMSLVFAGGVIDEHWRQLTPAKVLALLGVGSLQWVIIVTGSIIFAAYLPRVARQQFVGKLVGWGAMTFAVAVVARNFINLKLAIVWLHYVVPTGWPILLMGYGVLAQRRSIWLLLIGVLLLVLLAWRGLERLRAKYQVAEITVAEGAIATARLAQAPDEFDGLQDDELDRLAELAEDTEEEATVSARRQALKRWLDWLTFQKEPVEERQLSRDEAKEIIRSREFLEPFDWEQARWLERFWARAFDDSERRVAEFYCGGEPVWSQRLAAALVQTVGLLVVLYLATGIIGRGLFAATGHIALATFFGLMRGSWPAAIWKSRLGHFTSLSVVLPVRMSDLNRMTIVLGATRAAALFPVALTLSMLGIFGITGQWDWTRGMYYSAKSMLIFAVIHQWWWIALMPNGNSCHWFRKWFVDVACILSLMVLAVTGAIGLFAAGESELWSLGAAALMFGPSWFGHFWFQRALRNRPFDLAVSTHPLQQQAQPQKLQGNPEETW